MSSLAGKDTELDTIGRPFEPYLTAACPRLHAGYRYAALVCSGRMLFTNSMVLKLRRKPALVIW